MWGKDAMTDLVNCFGIFDISCMVTKDGGEKGGFPEKYHAASKAGIKLIVIKRPFEEGFGAKEVIDMINSSKNCTRHDV